MPDWADSVTLHHIVKKKTRIHIKTHKKFCALSFTSMCKLLRFVVKSYVNYSSFTSSMWYVSRGIVPVWSLLYWCCYWMQDNAMLSCSSGYKGWCGSCLITTGLQLTVRVLLCILKNHGFKCSLRWHSSSLFCLRDTLSIVDEFLIGSLFFQYNPYLTLTDHWSQWKGDGNSGSVCTEERAE